jgi:hypothetical protein
VCATTESATLWDQGYGSTLADAGQAVAVDGGGNILVAGYFQGAVDFGGGSLTSAGVKDIFVAKYSPTGAHVWSRGIGSTGNDVAYGIAVDGSGNVLVGGHFQGTVDFGGGSLTGTGGLDIFVAKYSPTGAHVWSRGIGSTGNDVAYGIAVDGSGNVIVTGVFQGSMDFGSVVLTSAGGSDIFLAKYSSTGTLQWAKRIGGVEDDYGYGVAVDGSGNIALTGYYRGAVDFGGGPLSSVGYTDIFVAKYRGTDGGYLWARGFGGTNYDEGRGVAMDAAGNVIVTGHFGDGGFIDFGGGAVSSAGNTDIFVAKYRGTDGGYLWSRHCTGSYYDHAYGISKVDASGNVVITGSFTSAIDFWGAMVFGYGGRDILVTKLNGTDGSLIWARPYGGSVSDVGTAVAVDQSGNIAVTGYFIDAVDFGTGLLVSAGSSDVFLLKLKP